MDVISVFLLFMGYKIVVEMFVKKIKTKKEERTFFYLSPYASPKMVNELTRVIKLI